MCSDTLSETTVFDRSGFVTEVIDGLGDKRVYQRDPQGRILVVRSLNENGSEAREEERCDAVSPEESHCVSPGFGKGPILSSYRYYPDGALRSEIHGAPLSYTVGWIYDLPGWPRTSHTSSAPRPSLNIKPAQILERDYLGNWTKITDGDRTHTRELVYDSRGNWIFWRASTGVESRREIQYY